MLNERLANQHRDHFIYTSYERSDRTGGHLWTERYAEVKEGHLGYLIEEDGKPLSPERKAEELIRLDEIKAHPAEFIKKEEARRKDELRATQMVDLRPHAFRCQQLGTEGNAPSGGGYLRIAFAPNPDYRPKTFDERVMHSMSGSILVEPGTLRLHQLDARLTKDVSFGFGLLATVRAGTSFHTVRTLVADNNWKATTVEAHIDCKAILFKTFNRNQFAEHKDFKQLPENLSLAEAVELLTQ